MEASDDDVDGILSAVPFRQKQISLLLNLFGTRRAPTCASIFIYGHTAAGKNFVLEAIFKKLRLPNVLVNCVECFNARLIFEHILNQVAALCHHDDDDYDHDDHMEFARCDNMNEFIRLFKKSLTNSNLDKETMYVVIDKCERLCDMEANLLPAFSRLNELTSCNICVIFLSEIIFEKFRQGTGLREPFLLQFPDYSKTQLQEIMVFDAPSQHPQEFYSNYCQLLLSVFYNVCRDLRELRHLAKLNFPKYCEPIISKEAGYSDVRKLWRNIEPHFRKALNTVFLQEVSSTQWEQMQDGGHVKGLSSYSTVELPFYSKYLLIAAYLASHNPARTDWQFFCKTTQKKMSKRGKIAAKTKAKADPGQLKVGGNKGERCLDFETNLLQLSQLNPHAEWVVKVKD